MDYRYIAIEGNIGSGKTTLSTLLASHYNARLLLEEFKDNPFLAHFYEDRARYAFPLELSFLADRYQQLKTVLQTQDLFSEHIISDYVYFKTKLFAKLNLNDDEFELFSRMAEILKLNISEPDLLIYIHASIPKLLDNIDKRGRAFEKNFDAQYLQMLTEAYHNYIQHEDIPVLYIDTTDVDIRDAFYLDQIIDLFEACYSLITQRINLYELQYKTYYITMK